MRQKISIHYYYNYPESDSLPHERVTEVTLYGLFVRYWLLLPMAFALVMLVTGIWGFYLTSEVPENQDDASTSQKLIQALWQTCQLPLGETLSVNELDIPRTEVPVQLQIARICGFAFAFSALLLLTWRTLSTPFKRLRIALIKHNPFVDYHVICGMGWKSYELAKDLRSAPEHRKKRLFVIEKDPNNPFLAEFNEDSKVIPIFGDATRQRVLERSGIDKAQKIYVLSNNDELNARITEQIVRVIDNKNKECVANSNYCYVNIKDIRTRAYLEDRTRDSKCNVFSINIEETTARRMLMHHPVAPVVTKDQPQSATHVVILGDSPIGCALFVEQLRTLHFLKGHKVRLTWYLEDKAESGGSFAEKKDAIYARWPFMDPNWTGDPQWKDVKNDFDKILKDTFRFSQQSEILFELEPLPCNESGVRSRSLSLYESLEDKAHLHLYVCLDDGIRSATLAALLEDGINAWHGRHVEKDRNKADWLKSEKFGQYSDECKATNLDCSWLDSLARRIDLYYMIKTTITYESNLVEEIRNADSLDAYLKETWDKMSEWKRESNRQCAAHLIVKLRMLGIEAHLNPSNQKVEFKEDANKIARDALALKDPDKLPQLDDLTYHDPIKSQGADKNLPALLEELSDMEHRRWNAERLLQGWLPTFDKDNWNKDRERFKNAWHLHYDLKLYEDLDEVVKAYDRFIVANLTQILETTKSILEKSK